jgi:hypothetical protein
VGQRRASEVVGAGAGADDLRSVGAPERRDAAPTSLGVAKYEFGRDRTRAHWKRGLRLKSGAPTLD